MLKNDQGFISMHRADRFSATAFLIVPAVAAMLIVPTSRAQPMNGSLLDDAPQTLRIPEIVRADGQTSNGAIELRPITVEGKRESATDPVNGYVADGSITGTKTDTPLIEIPQAISVITRDRLGAQNVSTLDQTLRYVPGVQAEVFGSEPRLTFLQIRGFDATTTGLFRNNLRLSSPRFFVSYSLEPYGAERIEVPRGPGSVVYGQASPGGLINYINPDELGQQPT